MEYLSRRLCMLKEDRLFKYHPKCSRLKISHLFFVDDLLLFCKADLYSIAKLKECLSDFSCVSGLETNPNKCSIYMSGIGDDLKAQICALLNFSEGVLPVRYLGVPLISKRLSYMDCYPLINKISTQLQNWQKKKALSYAGRLQLIKTVILGVQLYWTSNYVLPIKVLEKIDNLCSEFLWNHKIHLISWTAACQDKEHGGLGIFSARAWNLAAAMKLLWMIHLKKDLLWIKWIHGHYLRQSNIWQVQVKLNDSWMWKQMLKVRDKMISKFGNISNVLNIITRCCSGGKFQISSIYNEIIQQNAPVVWFRTVWDGWMYPKHSFILWLAIQSRLLTKARLCHLGILDTNSCVLCTHQKHETIGHLFFECEFSAIIWNRTMEWMNFRWKTCNWERVIQWYSEKLKGKGFMLKLKRLALSVTVYAIWKERNQRIFQHEAKGADFVFKTVKFLILSKVLNDDIPIHIKERIEQM
ncbi:uncharacterized protein LOC109831024 [Asparagus officinalis]|uniref:uncharacterized protein LOC109831024 n=1 Tax=Asparagus officinalis TaxID=4686 RepID=UPI00098DFDF8|nr:uncharacterized protein LOC109831024 [Asparagus officinalis]